MTNKFKIVIFTNKSTQQPVAASYSSSESKVDRADDRVSKIDAPDGKAYDIENKNNPDFLSLKESGNLDYYVFVNSQYTDEDGYFKIAVNGKKGANNLKANVLRHVTKEWNAFFKQVA